MSVVDPNGTAPVRVVQAGAPTTEAARLAGELGADMVADADAVRDAVRVRAAAARRASVGDPEVDAALLARAEAVRRAAEATPPMTEEDVAELRQVAESIRRSSLIRTRTESRVAEVLGARVASTAGVALHPSALAAAAEAVVDAEAAVADAERALLEHGSLPPLRGAAATAAASAAARAAAAVEAPVLTPHDDFDEARLDRLRLMRNTAAVLAALAVAAVVALAAGAPAALVAAGFAVLAVAGVVWVRRVTPRQEGEAAARAHLEAVAAAVANTETGRLAASVAGGTRGTDRTQAAQAGDGSAPDGGEAAVTAWLEERRALEAARDEAEELVRLAHNRWRQLAGPDADPHDPDAVIRAHDAQFTVAPRALAASPSVRTAATLDRRARARWRVLWARLGRDEPPPPEALEEVLAEALGEHRRAQEELARLVEAEERAAAAALARRPLVVLAPSRWAPPGGLTPLLAGLPDGTEVVVVEAAGGPGPGA